MHTHRNELQSRRGRASTDWTMRVSIALVTAGVFLFVYGALGSTPTLTASILGVPQEFNEAIRLFVPQSVFFTASLLIIGGACLDVWRRLRRITE